MFRRQEQRTADGRSLTRSVNSSLLLSVPSRPHPAGVMIGGKVKVIGSTETTKSYFCRLQLMSLLSVSFPPLALPPLSLSIVVIYSRSFTTHEAPQSYVCQWPPWICWALWFKQYGMYYCLSSLLDVKKVKWITYLEPLPVHFCHLGFLCTSMFLLSFHLINVFYDWWCFISHGKGKLVRQSLHFPWRQSEQCVGHQDTYL